MNNRVHDSLTFGVNVFFLSLTEAVLGNIDCFIRSPEHFSQIEKEALQPYYCSHMETIFSPLPQKNPCLQMEGTAFITEKGKKKGDGD